MSTATLASPRNRIPPGGRSSIVFDDSAPPIISSRVSYSLTAANSSTELNAPFSKPAKGGLFSSSRGSSMKDLLTDTKGPDTPRSRKARVSPGGPTTIVLA